VGVAITSRHVPTRAGVRAITVYTFLALVLYFAHLCMGARLHAARAVRCGNSDRHALRQLPFSSVS
jgi:hypothetical protein